MVCVRICKSDGSISTEVRAYTMDPGPWDEIPNLKPSRANTSLPLILEGISGYQSKCGKSKGAWEAQETGLLDVEGIQAATPKTPAHMLLRHLGASRPQAVLQTKLSCPTFSQAKERGVEGSCVYSTVVILRTFFFSVLLPILSWQLVSKWLLFCCQGPVKLEFKVVFSHKSFHHVNWLERTIITLDLGQKAEKIGKDPH